MNKLLLILLILLLFIVLNEKVTAQKYGHALIDSLYFELDNTNKDSDKVILLNALSKSFISRNQFEKGLSFCERALSISKKLNWEIGIANSHRNFGKYYYQKKEHIKSLYFLKSAQDIYLKYNNKEGIAITSDDMSINYCEQGEYFKALELAFKNLNADEASKNKKWISKDKGTIGFIYCRQGNLSKGIEYTRDAYLLDSELNNKEAIESDLNNLTQVFISLHNYAAAQECINLTLNISKEVGDTLILTSILNQAGQIDLNQGLYPLALNEFFEALEYSRKFNYINGIALNFQCIANTYLHIANDSVGIINFFNNLSTRFDKNSPPFIQKLFNKISRDTIIPVGKLKNIRMALKYYDSSLSLFKKSGLIYQKTPR